MQKPDLVTNALEWKQQRRLGKIEVAADLVEADPHLLAVLQQHCIVMNMEWKWFERTVVMIVIAPAFDILAPAMQIPNYAVQFETKIPEGDDPTPQYSVTFLPNGV